MYYAQARYYLPEIGRFISEDPWSGSLAIPTTLNPYPYVLNNPLKYVDPTGAIYQNLFYMQDEGSGQSFIYNPTGQANTKQPHPPLSSSKTISDGGQDGENHIGWGTKIVDVGLDIIPGVGSIKSGQEALFGVNLVTGEDLTNTERIISGIGAIPGGKTVIKGSQLAIDSGKHVYKKGKDIVSNVLGKGKGNVVNNGNKINWGSWNDYPKVKANGQEYAQVGDRLYSKHAVDRMQPSGNRYGSQITQAGGEYGRSVSPTYVEDVIRNTKPVVQQNGNLSYTSGTLQVITNKDGTVVTIITK